MRVQPLFCCRYLSHEERIKYECSDSFFICHSWFTSMNFQPDTEILLKITNANDEQIVGNVCSTHPDKDILYVPSRLFSTLSISDNVTIESVILPNCTMIVFQPQNISYCSNPLWKDMFLQNLRNYTTITHKTNLVMNVGNIETFTILSTLPYKQKFLYLKHGNPIDIRFRTAKEEETNEWKQRHHFPQKILRPNWFPFSGEGNRTGNEISKPSEKTQNCLQAALRRIKDNQS